MQGGAEAQEEEAKKGVLLTRVGEVREAVAKMKAGERKLESEEVEVALEEKGEGEGQCLQYLSSGAAWASYWDHLVGLVEQAVEGRSSCMV